MAGPLVGVIYIEPASGDSIVVSLDATAYTTAALTATHTFPETITTRTGYFVTTLGPVTISTLRGGVEVASTTGTKSVSLSYGQSVTVTPVASTSLNTTELAGLFAGALFPGTAKTAPYTAVAGDLVPVDLTSGSVTITLPTAPADKTRVAVKVVALTGTYTCTIARGGSDVFNKAAGATSLTLSTNFQAVNLQYQASTGIWFVVGDNLALGQLDARYGFRLNPTAVKTSNYSAVAGDYVPCDTSGGLFAITLPTAPADGTVVGVKVVTAGNPLTLAVGGSDVFNKAGLVTGSLQLLNQAAVFQYRSSGAIWYAVLNDLPLGSLATGWIKPSQADATAIANSVPPLVVDTGGPFVLVDSQTSTNFVEQPTGLAFLPNGNLAVAYRYASPGADSGASTGSGLIKFAVYSPDGVQLVAPTTIAQDTTGSLYDCRASTLTLLSDGRLLLVFTTAPNNSGNPNGMGTGPDSVVGNNRYMIGTISGNTVTWPASSAAITIVSGFNTSTGFDSTGYNAPFEIVPGTLILTVVGKDTALTWDNNEVVTYQVGTFTAGGAITWASKSTNNPATVAGHTTGENSLRVCANGDWLMLWRDSASLQIYYSKATAGANAPTAGGSWVNGTWSAGAVLPNVGTKGYANPNLIVMASGLLAFPTRGSISPVSSGLLCTSNDNGTTWQAQPLDMAISGQSYLYGALAERPTVPGQVAVAYEYNTGSTVTTIRWRWAVEGGGFTPFGSMVATGLTAPNATVGNNLFLPGYSFGVTPFAKATLGSTRAPTEVYVDPFPSDRSWTMANDIAVTWQNMDRYQARDDGSPLATGVLYLMRIRTANELQFRYLRIWLGATPAVSITHSWATWLRISTNNPGSSIISSADITSTPSTNVSRKFDFGSTQTQSQQSAPADNYFGIVFVGATMPSILGRSVQAPIIGSTPILLGAATGAGTGLTTPWANLSTPGAPSGGGSFQPFIELSTS